MKKKNSVKSGILLAILFLAIGFATITTTLIITGVITLVPDTNDFEENVIFATATLDATSTAAGATAVIAPNGKSITLTTQTLKSIDEEVVLTYTIKNDSQYDAKIGALSCTSTDDAYNKYLNVTPANALVAITEANPIASGATSSEDTLSVKLKKSYVSPDGSNTNKTVEFTCSLEATAVSN